MIAYASTKQGVSECCGELAQLATEYVSRTLRFASPATRLKYSRAIRAFGQYLGRPAGLVDLEHELVLDFLASINRSPHTANEYRAKLVALWNYAAKTRRVEKFPTIEKLRAPKRLPIALGVDEFRALLRAAERMPGEIDGIPASAWWRALLLLGWATGERRTALLGFRWRDYSPASGQLIARAESRKGRDRDRLYVLPPWAMAALAALPRPGECILSSRSRRASYFRDWSVLLRLAGLPDDRWHKTHALRRSHASHLAAAGIDPSKALGHSSPLVTYEHYIDPRVMGASRHGHAMPSPLEDVAELDFGNTP